LKIKFREITAYFALIFITFLFVFPYLYMVLSAFKSPLETFAYPPVWIFKPNFKNFASLILDYEPNIVFYVSNSLLVSTSTTIISLLIGLLAAYSFARFNFRLKEMLFVLFLLLLLFPSISWLIAFYILARSLGLYDTQLMLILVYNIWNIPLAIWLMRGFIEEVPLELEESALIDGYSRLGVLFRVTLPLALPGLIVTGILIFITAWNEFTLAYFLTEVKANTLPTMIGLFRTHTEIMWGKIFALSFLSTLPVIIFSLAIRKYFVTGLTFGAIKK